MRNGLIRPYIRPHGMRPLCKTLKVVEVIGGPPSTAHRDFKVYSAPPVVQHVPHKVRRDLKQGRKRIRPHLPGKVDSGIRKEKDPNTCNAKQHGLSKRI